jgi:hypothetical protein
MEISTTQSSNNVQAKPIDQFRIIRRKAVALHAPTHDGQANSLISLSGCHAVQQLLAESHNTTARLNMPTLKCLKMQPVIMYNHHINIASSAATSDEPIMLISRDNKVEHSDPAKACGL